MNRKFVPVEVLYADVWLSLLLAVPESKGKRQSVRAFSLGDLEGWIAQFFLKLFYLTPMFGQGTSDPNLSIA